METPYSKTEVGNLEVAQALSQIGMPDLERLKFPIVVAGNNKILSDYYENNDSELFWKTIFNQQNFVTPSKTVNPETDMLFILHSFIDTEGRDHDFAAITTLPKKFIEQPTVMINYLVHGKPCEGRSKETYPRINFWDFYRHLTEEEQDKYPVPDKGWRAAFYKRNF